MTAPRAQLRHGRWIQPGSRAEDSPEALAIECERAQRAARRARPIPTPAALDRLIFGLSNRLGTQLAALTEREFILLLVLISLLLGIAGKAL